MFRTEQLKKEKVLYSLKLFKERLSAWNKGPVSVHPTLDIQKLEKTAKDLHQKIIDKKVSAKASTLSTSAVGVTEKGVWYVVSPKPSKLTPEVVKAAIVENMGVEVSPENIVILRFTSSEFHAEIKALAETVVNDKLMAVAASQPCCTYCGGYLNYMQIPRPSTPGKDPLFTWRHPNSRQGFEPSPSKSAMGGSDVVEREHALKGIRIPSPENRMDVQLSRKIEEVVGICCKIDKIAKNKAHKDLVQARIKAVSEMAIKIESLSREEKNQDRVSNFLSDLESYREASLVLMQEALAPTPEKKTPKKKNKNRKNKKKVLDENTPTSTPSGSPVKKDFGKEREEKKADEKDCSPLKNKNTPPPLRSHRGSPESLKSSPEAGRDAEVTRPLGRFARKLDFGNVPVGENRASFFAALPTIPAASPTVDSVSPPLSNT